MKLSNSRLPFSLPVRVGETTVLSIQTIQGVARISSYISRLGHPDSKLGKTFSLGYGLVRTSSYLTGDITADGATDVAFTGDIFAYDGNWTTASTPGLYTPSDPAFAPHINFRSPTTAYLNGEQAIDPFGPFVLAPTPNEPRLKLSLDLDIRPDTANDLLRLRIPADNLVRFEFMDNEASWPSMTTFSATTSDSHTIVASTMLTYRLLFHTGVRNSGSIVAEGFHGDGATSVAIGAQQISEGQPHADGTSSVAIGATKVHPGEITADGSTSVAIVASQIHYAEILVDGSTDVAITDTSYLTDGWQGDGVADVSVDTQKILYGLWSADGSTEVAFNYEPYIDMSTPATDVAFTAAQVCAATLNMDGATSVDILGSQKFAGTITADGVFAWSMATQKLLNASLTMDGATDVSFDPYADYYVQINADGATSISIVGSLIAGVQIVATGVGDMFADAFRQVIMELTADGSTDVSPSAIANFLGTLSIAAGTDVSILPFRQINVYINADGSTNVYIQTNQDQFGEVVFDQINQEFSALGTYIFEDGSVYPTANSNATFDGKHIPLGPDYIWGIIEEAIGYGSPDFVPLSLSAFTAFGKTGVNLLGPNQLGYHKHKYAFGFSRPASAFYGKRTQDFTREEWVRFNFFVDSATDFTQISSSTGFTSGGISGVAGSGVVGRDIEKYVTFSVLTHGIMTQANYEALADGDPNALVTQSNYEMLWIPDSHVFTTQVVGEVLYLANLAAIQQIATEAMAGALDAQRHGLVNQIAVEMMHTIRAAGLITQVSVEGVHGDSDPNVNITQATIEILTYAQQFFNATALVHQVAVEQLATGDAQVTINGVAIEEMNSGTPMARINSEVIETIHNNDRNANVQQIAIEELNNGQGNGAVQQIAIEMLVRPEFDPTVAGLVNNPKFHV